MRTQWDNLQDTCSQLYGQTFPADEDRTRQEDRHHADINHLMKQFLQNPASIPQKVEAHGEIDFDLSYHEAMEATRAATALFGRLTPEQRQGYPDVASWLHAAAEGRLDPAPAVSTVPVEADGAVPPAGAAPNPA